MSTVPDVPFGSSNIVNIDCQLSPVVKYSAPPVLFIPNIILTPFTS